jgi:hypothetical protein
VKWIGRINHCHYVDVFSLNQCRAVKLLLATKKLIFIQKC